MAMNFPDSPSNGDRVALNGKLYAYDDTASKWTPVTGARVTLSDTAPLSPSAGDLWFDTADGSLYVYYNDGSSSQWVSFSGSTGRTGTTGTTGGVGGAVASYADITARDAATPSLTEMAWVISNTSLYIWDGTEWDRVYSGVQLSPIWTTVPLAYYTLPSNSASTQVTIAATDPEGFDIDYSVSVTPTNQTQATITHAGNGVFDITSAQDDGTNDGTFTARFAASDGLISLPFYSTFTLSSYNRYEVAYTALTSGSVIPVMYQGAGSHDITSIVQGSTDGDAILLSPGTYELTPHDNLNVSNDPFWLKNIAITGQSQNANDVVLTINQGTARDFAIFTGGGSTAMSRHFANLRIIRKCDVVTTYRTALAAQGTGGVAQNCIIDLDGGRVSWAYNSSLSDRQTVWKNCSFVNYTQWDGPWSGADNLSNLVLNCAFSLPEHLTGRTKLSYDGSTFTAENATSAGTSIAFDSVTNDYTDKTLFGHLKDAADQSPIVSLTQISRSDWYGV
mgnify:CR=1 FL=1